MATVKTEGYDEGDGSDLNILILSAGAPRGMKNLGPISNLEIFGGETLVKRQIRLLKEKFPNSQIVFVGGFQAENAFKALPKDIMVVENELYEDCSIGRSIELGIRVCIKKRLLIIYGDLIFDENFLDNLPKFGSWVFLSDRHSKEVGANVGKGVLRLFNYSIDNPKWNQICLLDGIELSLLKTMIENYRDKLGHEIINGIIRKGGTINAHFPPGKMFEVDTKEDLKLAKGNIFE